MRKRESSGKYEASSMKILILNLRDIRNPNSGGAEVFTHEIAKRLIEHGHIVDMISSSFPGAKPDEIIDGVSIRRMGNSISVFSIVKKYYKSNLINNYDIIIDEYTNRPFLSTRFVKEPIVFLVHELAREKYFIELPPILSHILYYYLEPAWITKYKQNAIITVSESTKRDLERFNLRNIYIVPVGIDFKPLSGIPIKEEYPTMLFVGLLKKSNLVDHAIKAFELVEERLENSKLLIMGRGPQFKRLKKMAKSDNIEFLGYVDEKEKLKIMSKAHVLLMPAVREGWGLVVTEANGCGTPVIGYNVNGLKDSIQNEITGLLCENSPYSMAQKILRFFNDDELRRKLTYNSLNWSREFSWERTTHEFERILEGLINE